jgi:hypothetical protein
MSSQQVQNKPTAAYILSLLGGIIGLLASLALLAFGAIAYTALGSYSYYYGYYDFGLGWGWTTMLGLGGWALITSILIIVFARRLNANPMEHSKYGALILVFSLIGVGGWLALIGGILALVYKPIPVGGQPYGYAPQQPYAPAPQYAPQQSVPQNITRICPKCGRVVNENVKFCPHCGNQLG